MFDLVVLDTGFKHKENIKNIELSFFNFKNNIWKQTNNHQDEVGHGTSVLLPILLKLKNDYKNTKFNIAVFNVFVKKRDNLMIMKNALNYIYKNLKCKFIQMSNGICGYDKELDDICYKLYKKGIIIISSMDNHGAIAYPAGFDYTLGVLGNKYLSDNEFVVRDNNIVDIEAKTFLNPMFDKISKGTLQFGNSFSASFVSLKLIIEYRINKRNIKTKEDAKKVIYPSFNSEKHISFNEIRNIIVDKRIAVFPLNKENYSLINYSDNLICKSISFFDSKYNGNIGQEKLGFNGKKYVISNIDNIDYSTFDTLIIGHTDDLEKLIKREIKTKLIDNCLKNKKNVYCYDSVGITDEIREKYKKEGLFLYCSDDIPYIDNQGFLYQHKTPIICVIGTSPHQGKFTLQLQIINLLKKEGFNVGFFGSEPTSILLGASSMCSYGYRSRYSKTLPETKVLEHINTLIHDVDKQDFDVIVTGMQSQFLPRKDYCFYNTKFNLSCQFPFIYATNPDCIILCIDYYDPIEFIVEAVKTVELLSKAKVICIALNKFLLNYDFIINKEKRVVDKQDFEIKRKEIKKALKLPLVLIGDTNCNSLISNTVKDFFKEE